MEARKIGGKTFYLDKICGTKSIAKNHAQMLKDRGIAKGARVFRVGKDYEVWARQK